VWLYLLYHFIVLTRLEELSRSSGKVIDSQPLELTNCQCCKRAVKLQTVRDVLGDGFEIKIEGGHHLGSPCVVENNVLEALRGCYE
jgi:hypothetical protein